MFSELQYNQPNPVFELESTKMKTDSTWTISQIRTQQISERNKHIDFNAHRVKELHISLIIKFVHEHTSLMAYEILTKAYQEFELQRLFSYFNR